MASGVDFGTPHPLSLSRFAIQFISRVDMGTADELCLDVLVNMMRAFSKEHVGIRKLVIGGENASWPVPAKQKSTPMKDPELERIAKKAREAEEAKRTAAERESREVLDSMLDTEPYMDDLIGDVVDF